MHCYYSIIIVILAHLVGQSYAYKHFNTLEMNELGRDVIRNRSRLMMTNFYRGMLHKHDDVKTVYSLSKFHKVPVPNQDFLRVCYYSYGDPVPSKVNATLCTHIIKGFASISDGKLSPGGSHIETWKETTDLKKKFPHLKVMLSMGGGGFDQFAFSYATGSKQNRTRLIDSCLRALVKYNFDGLDIDWEFPVWNDFVKADKKNFVLFLRDFKNAANMLRNSMLLSIAVAAPQNIIDDSYDVPAIAQYVDFINLMSYDYHDYTFYTPFTGHNSPLFNRSKEHAYFATLNTAWSSVYWFQKGMPREKIMVGLPTYGHTYKLLDPDLHDFDSPAVGYGRGQGSTTYPEVCAFLKNGGTRVFDKESMVPYAYKDYDWLGYDDYESIAAKTTWVKSMQFGGVMTFDLNCDDWQGICDGKTTFPLHQIIYDILTKN